MKVTTFTQRDYVMFTFIPDEGEILSGVQSVWVNGRQEFCVTVSREVNKKKMAKIKASRARLQKAILGAMTVTP